MQDLAKMPDSAPTAAEGRDPPTSAPSVADESVVALTTAMVKGDRDAYARLFAERCDFVEREAARRLGRRRDLVLDAAQEAWMRVARAPRRCDSAAKLDAWLGRVVTSAAIDLLRSELSRCAREERVARSRSEAQDFIVGVELLETLRRHVAATAGLSTDERALLELRVRTGASLSQLAAIVGLGRSAVDSRLRRAAELARQTFEGTTS